MSAIFDALDATWPAAAIHRAGAFDLREGRGGGQRVSAATAAAPWTPADIDSAEALHARLGQSPLFMIRSGEVALDADLAARGYQVKDPVAIYRAAPDDLAARALSPMAAFAIWPPLAIIEDIWSEGGIGPGRLAVMRRVQGPCTAVLGRVRDRAAGAAFVAVHAGCAMIHAIHVVPALRRHGTGGNMIGMAARWATSQGADALTLAVTTDNTGACALYASLGMEVVEQYHYRVKPEQKGRARP